MSCLNRICLLVLLTFGVLFAEPKMGICNGIKFNTIGEQGVGFETGFFVKRDDNLSARLLLNVLIKNDSYNYGYQYSEMKILPDISISYAVLKRKYTNVNVGLGFSTEFRRVATGYVPLGVEYMINNEFSFIATMKIGAYYEKALGERHYAGGLFGGDFGIVYFL